MTKAEAKKLEEIMKLVDELKSVDPSVLNSYIDSVVIKLDEMLPPGYEGGLPLKRT